MTIKIIIADDHKIFREGLIGLLKELKGVAVIGEAENGESAANLVKKLNPDIAIMDTSMPVMDGIRATQIIRDHSVNTRVIALSEDSNRHSVSGMLQAGAQGYLLKDCAFQELAEAIHNVHAGESYLSREVRGIVIEEYLNKLNGNGSSMSRRLTKREMEVLKLIAAGIRTREIASRLDVSIKTIETHRRQMMKKLNIFSVAGLTKYAIKEGLASV